jgi:hypothetical protein
MKSFEFVAFFDERGIGGGSRVSAFMGMSLAEVL